MRDHTKLACKVNLEGDEPGRTTVEAGDLVNCVRCHGSGYVETNVHGTAVSFGHDARPCVCPACKGTKVMEVLPTPEGLR